MKVLVKVSAQRYVSDLGAIADFATDLLVSVGPVTLLFCVSISL